MIDTQNETSSQRIAQAIAARLEKAIEGGGKASLVVCGGSSPLGVFDALSKIQINWEAVHITLADDRLV